MSADTQPDAGTLTWCEVSAEALDANVRVFRQRLAPGARLGVVVKSNAYGHGLVLASRVFVEAGADWLVADSLEEAETLRAAGIDVPLYVCGYVPPALADRAVATGARLVVYDPDLVDALGVAGVAAGSAVPVHVKVETGNHRQGLRLPEALALAARIAATDGVRLEGVATHYADIEDTTDHRFARSQLDRFREAVRAFEEAGYAPPMQHSSNSAATILWPETHGSLARVGIAAYGLWPSTETYATALTLHATRGDGFVPELRPALAWRTRIVQTKLVPAGGYVGYGRTFRATHPLRMAVLPVGYNEGYDRRLSNLAHVLVDGVRAPVRGRVCMNMTMVDVTDIPNARVGSVATLLGEDGSERLTAEQLAGWMGTINYEVVSRIHPSLPRLLRRRK